MKILVINCGSSTIKFQLYNMDTNEVLAKGRCDKLGLPSSNLVYKAPAKGISYEKEIPMKDHEEGMEVLLKTLVSEDDGVISSLDEISAVGHRLVHGGEKFSKATLINDEVVAEIEKLVPLAPLHNPACIIGIKTMEKVLPNVPSVAVFDTAFHQTIPAFNYLYAINYDYYTKYGIRRYGFHGSSYKYILDRLEEILGKKRENINAIVCHLGSGASMCAIKDGKSYDTSMGLTPLEGLVMETRCGDIDPSIVMTLMEKENLSLDEVTRVLNKESGRLGLSGIGDQRQLIKAANEGNERAMLTRQIQAMRTKKYIGSYMAELNRVDAIVFTGGNGENNECERRMCVSEMENLGVKLDKERNFNGSRKESLISSDDSKVKIFVIPTDEELEIASETMEAIKEIK